MAQDPMSTIGVLLGTELIETAAFSYCTISFHVNEAASGIAGRKIETDGEERSCTLWLTTYNKFVSEAELTDQFLQGTALASRLPARLD